MIEIKNLKKTYDRHRRHANTVLHDVTLTLPDTGFVCILGPSGCGKTSLLNAIGGLDAFDSGTITTGSVSTNRYGTALFEAERNRSFGYIFQNYYLLSEHSVGYNVYLGLHSLKLSHDEKLRRVEDALKAVEMERYFHRNVGELSGGQQQRVAIARALARKPRIIFADEPTGNLDEANTRNICTLLRKISKTSLVVMVTHEERIARFFADRIITLDAGRISGDTDTFQRGSLSDARQLYTGDYTETSLISDGVKIRCFREEGCPEIEVSILALKDRIIIKLADDRAVTCGRPEDQPTIVDGSRPQITLEELDQEESGPQWDPSENVTSRAGQGIRFRDMLTEALHMSRGRGKRNLGTRIFLLVLTLLTALSVADIVTLSTIDPRDFIVTHSQMLEVDLERGPGAALTTLGMMSLGDEFKSYLLSSGLEFLYVPSAAGVTTVSGSTIRQTNDLAVTLKGYRFVPISFLSEEQLIMGRMPERGDEIVIDRWVLDAALSEDGVAQNGITGIDYFLNKTLKVTNQSFEPTIVGISDSAEAAVYIPPESFAALGINGTPVATLSELQREYPGVYDDITLAEDQCLVLPANAGVTYRNMIYAKFNTGSRRSYTIVGVVEEKDFYAKIVVSDEQIANILYAMSPQKFYIFCEDKAAMTEYLQSIPGKMGNSVSVTVTDAYAEAMGAYQQASQLRLDGRTIVTATVMLLSMVMLYLLRRAQVYDRIGMLSVYRLLGIPARKAVGIFCIESAIGTLVTAAPTAVAVWAVLALLEKIPELDFSMRLPWQAAVLVYCGIVCFHLLVTVLPLIRLMRRPPAQLAAKFDF